MQTEKGRKVLHLFLMKDFDGKVRGLIHAALSVCSSLWLRWQLGRAGEGGLASSGHSPVDAAIRKVHPDL